jgi:hypothetical protein
MVETPSFECYANHLTTMAASANVLISKRTVVKRSTPVWDAHIPIALFSYSAYATGFGFHLLQSHRLWL